MKKNLIYIPDYGDPVGYRSIDEVIDAKGDLMKWYLTDIVRYNLRYRDFARSNDIGATVDMLLKEAPRLKDFPEAIENLSDNLVKNPIADIDLFVTPRNEPIPRLGVTVDRLARAVDLSAMRGDSTFLPMRDHEPLPVGLHVMKYWESPPCFDEYDRMYDSRTFDNYFISPYPFYYDTLDEIRNLRGGANNCKVTESTPPELLPAVYDGGDTGYLIVGMPRGFKSVGFFERIKQYFS